MHEEAGCDDLCRRWCSERGAGSDDAWRDGERAPYDRCAALLFPSWCDGKRSRGLWTVEICMQYGVSAVLGRADVPMSRASEPEDSSLRVVSGGGGER